MSQFVQMITKILPRLPSQDDRERAYLEAAVSLYDLECREREIALGKFNLGRNNPGWH